MNRDAADPFAGPPPGAPDPDDGPVPTLLERPDLYQRIVRLVRATADHLRQLGPGTSALVAAAERGPELVAAVADDNASSIVELDLDLVARAALALRYREVRAEQATRRRLRRVEEARAAGATWVVVEETGAPGGDPFLPYSRLEVATASGGGLLVTAAPDDEYRGAVHQVRRVHLDLSTGELADQEAGADVTTYPDAATRDAAASRARADLEGP
jgi:hypothetical protein